MGASQQSFDIFQGTMQEVFRDLDELENYTDDVGCFSMAFSNHMNSLNTILLSSITS